MKFSRTGKKLKNFCLLLKTKLFSPHSPPTTLLRTCGRAKKQHRKTHRKSLSYLLNWFTKTFLMARLLLFLLALPALCAAQAAETILLPGTEVSFTMVQLEGGSFNMGKTKQKVTLSPFSIGTHEVTFDAYRLFARRDNDTDESTNQTYSADAISRPSPPYLDFTYGMGTRGAANGSTKRPAASSACPPKQNGNTPAWPEQPKTELQHKIKPGFPKTVKRFFIKPASKSPTPGASTT